MKKLGTAFDTSLLPQYAMSAAFTERFLIAAHRESVPIERSPNSEGVKFVDASELEVDLLTYFTENKEAFREEFSSELRNRLPGDIFTLFCEVLALEWFDGMSKRKGGRCRRLKRSIHDYLCALNGSDAKIVQTDELPLDVAPLIDIEHIAAILTVNDQMIYRHIEAWKQSHPNSDIISDSDVFLRRGMSLNDKLNVSEPYRERDFISSYSIAFSAPEKFSQIRDETPVLVNGEITLFAGRILFFSPFIPGMDATQLEFGVIPSVMPQPISYQGSHGGIHEYIIDPAPFHI
ncbi:hypothetical protein SAMN03159443_01902 [Pseudomonas sp. NFACC15-1]|uniref:hypothetical protein n=1 Tax=unclassified Pseudomonas TaxID=196821 RepID=UPI0008879A65|nr:MULTISPECIES: hypothetical protein [unclassified Pseudomonas]SDA63374.1 hypothetical protein SAMN03159443_01902 [Pseudomonas sp. NFACC15-1]SDX92285.1 hypothetical protein SAMN03159380_03109 [Pseudomonas sp. NFACC14]